MTLPNQYSQQPFVDGKLYGLRLAGCRPMQASASLRKMSMAWDMHVKEFEAVVGFPAPQRYEYFIKRVTDWESVWGLHTAGGWVLASSQEGQVAFPVWPHCRFAAACSVGEWAGALGTEIPLTQFLDRWVTGLAHDDRTVTCFRRQTIKASSLLQLAWLSI